MASGDGTGTPGSFPASSKPRDMGLSTTMPSMTTLFSHGRAPLAAMLMLLRPKAPASGTADVTPGESESTCVKLRLESGTAVIMA